MAIQGIFYGLDLPTLTTIKANYVNCLAAIAGAGQSYSISGRSFTRANIAEVANMVQEAQAAIDRLNNTRTTQFFPDMSRSIYPK